MKAKCGVGRTLVACWLSAGLSVVLLLSIVAPREASAQESGEQGNAEARAILEEAQRLYNDGQYALAAEKYLDFRRRLIALGNPRAPLALWNAGLALSHIPGRETEALQTLEQFINDSHGLNDDPEVRDMRSEAQVKIAELRVRAGPSGGGGGGVWIPGVIIASIGAATAITGAIIGGVALSNSASATEGCNETICPSATSRSAIDDAQLLANVSDGLLFGGLGVTAVGVVLMFVVQEGGDTPSASAVCTSTGCAATLRGTF